MKQHQLDTIEVFNRTASEFSNTIAKLKNYDDTYDYLAGLLSENSTLLDLACGPGNISGYLVKKKRFDVVGIDLSDEMLKIAKNKIPHGKFYGGSIIDFKLPRVFDAVVNGFGLPYLDGNQARISIENSYSHLNDGGLIYLSFMNGTGSGYEIPSFKIAEKLYIYYHSRDDIIRMITSAGFRLLKKWELDYKEMDGSITTDIVLIGRKQQSG